jgi:hypothetical protein
VENPSKDCGYNKGKTTVGDLVRQIETTTTRLLVTVKGKTQ